MTENSEEKTPKDFGPRLLLYLGVAVFIMQLAGQYGVFVQVPEALKAVTKQLDNLQSSAEAGRLRHVEVAKDISEIQREILASEKARSDLTAKVYAYDQDLRTVMLLKHQMDRSMQAYTLMESDDKSQWLAIREMEKRISLIEHDLKNNPR